MMNETCVALFFIFLARIPYSYIYRYIRAIRLLQRLYSSFVRDWNHAASKEPENLRVPPNLISCSVCECNAFCVL